MSMSKATKIIAKIGAVSALTLSIGAISQVSAGATSLSPTSTTAATISVSPASGIVDGASVTVSGSGLAAGSVYHVGECAAVSGTEFACNSGEAVDVAANSSGQLSTSLPARKTFQGSTADGGTTPIDCGAVTCVIGVYDAAFNGGSANISFA